MDTTLVCALLPSTSTHDFRVLLMDIHILYIVQAINMISWFFVSCV